jgi:hypothetical protein
VLRFGGQEVRYDWSDLGDDITAICGNATFLATGESTDVACLPFPQTPSDGTLQPSSFAPGRYLLTMWAADASGSTGAATSSVIDVVDP